MSLLHRVRSTLSGAFDPAAPGFTGFLVLLTLVLAAPYPYGGILPGGTLVIELLAFLSAALAFLGPPRPLAAARVPLIAGGGIALLGLLQIVPVSPALLARIAPASLQVYAETNDVLRVFARPPVAPRVSIAPADSVATAVLVLAYAAAFLAALRILQLRARRRVFMGAVVVSALVQLSMAAVSDEAQAGGRLHGPFVNPDHFAGYLEIPLALAFAWVWMAVRMKAGRREDGMERRVAAVAGSMLLWGTLAAGVGLSKSRGGILAGLVTAATLLFLSVFRHRHRTTIRAGWVGAGILSVGLLFAALITREGPFLRFLADDPRDIGADMRVRIWSTSLEAFRQSPLLGTGLGSFREGFRRVQPASLTGLVEEAHNDILQLLVTGGVVAGLLGALAVLATGRGLLQGWARQQHREERILALSAFGALLSLTLHGVVDFSLSLPAVAVTLAATVGAGWAAGRASIEARANSTGAPAAD